MAYNSMTAPAIDVTHDIHRTAGWAAVAAGLCGLGAFAFIIAALFIRSDARHMGALMFRGHDTMSLIQTFCMFAVVAALCSLANRPIPKLASRVANGTLAVLAIALLLTLAHVLNDMLYMVPQGIFGAWMIWIGCHLSGVVPRDIKWLGIVAGVGLILVGVFPLAFGLFVDPIVFRGPMPENYQDVNSLANLVTHIILGLGTLIGATLYPIWCLAVGRTLLRQPS